MKWAGEHAATRAPLSPGGPPAFGYATATESPTVSTDTAIKIA
jgi:hypothetical protein